MTILPDHLRALSLPRDDRATWARCVGPSMRGGMRRPTLHPYALGEIGPRTDARPIFVALAVVLALIIGGAVAAQWYGERAKETQR